MDILNTYETYLKAQDSYAPNTIHNYIGCVRSFLEWVHEHHPEADDVSKITPDIVEDWFVDHASWGISTKQLNIIAIRAFFEYLTQKRVCAENPCGILKSVKSKKRVDESQDRGKEDRVYSPDDLLALIQFDEIRFTSQILRDRAIIGLMAASGMRASEVAWLNVGQIRNRQDNEIFALRKGQNIKRISVADYAFDLIDEYLATRGDVADDEPLFLTRRGNRIDRTVIYDILSVRQKALGLRTGTHNIRYTVLNASERYGGAVIARDIAGQKNLNVTNRYMVSSREERKAAIQNLPWAKKLEK